MTHIRRSFLLTLAVATTVFSGAGLAQERPSPAASREGITVHGHWVIQVDNPDGSVATRREFENALTSLGPGLLAGVLGHQNSVGFWRISIQNLSPTGASDGGPCTFNGQPTSCSLWENVPNFNVDPASNSRNLSVTVPRNTVTNLPAGTVELSGSITASQNSGVGFVTTSFRYCLASVSPEACSTNQAGSSEAPLTSRKLPANIPVAAGQVIRIWVTLSFS